jgi:glycerol uptake facilitator-like aquaporin
MSDINKYVVEAVGTFFFLSVILHTLTDNTLGPHAVAIALLAAIYFGNSVSGAHFNPAVSFVMFLENKLTFNLFIAYFPQETVSQKLLYPFCDTVSCLL